MSRLLVSHSHPIPVMLGQPFVANIPVGPLDIAFCCGLPSRICSSLPPSSSPLHYCRAWILRAVIAPNGRGLASPADDLLDGAHHAFDGQRKVDINVQRLAVQVINHVEHPKAAPVGELVAPQVQRPTLVQVGWYRPPRGHVRRETSEFHVLHCYLPRLALYTRRGISARTFSDRNQPAL